MERLRLLVTTAGLMLGFLAAAAFGEQTVRPEIRAGSGHGTGIPASILGKVKEPFLTTKPGALITRPGLSISNAISTNHKGSLGIDSREGEYTRVAVELPAAARSGGGGNS